MRTLAFLALLTLLPAAGRALPPARWEGSVQIPGRELPLVVDLAVGADGQWSGSAILPGFGIKGAALAEIAVTEAGASFRLKEGLSAPGITPPQFKARLADDGTLVGEFSQAGNTAPFRLRRAGPPQVEPSRRGTGATKELAGVWKGSYELIGYPRDATLTLAVQPGAAGPADFVIVGKKTNQVPVDFLAVNGDFLVVESSAFGIAFEGRLKKEGDEIRGTFTQGPFELPLLLRRARP